MVVSYTNLILVEKLTREREAFLTEIRGASDRGLEGVNEIFGFVFTKGNWFKGLW